MKSRFTVHLASGEKTGRGMVIRPTSVLSSISIWFADAAGETGASIPVPTTLRHSRSLPRGLPALSPGPLALRREVVQENL